jgi:hypothetical protein
VDEAAFREGWASSSAGSGQECIGYSPFLHLAILACAAHISNRTDLEPFNGDGNQSSPGSKDLTFTSRAVDMLDKEIEHPRPTSIQGLTLLIMVVADCGKNSFAWVYCGQSRSWLMWRDTQLIGRHSFTTFGSARPAYRC